MGSSVVPTTSAAKNVEPKQEEAPVSQKQEEAVISGAPPAPDQAQVEHRVVAKEEKVEYRDQDGNLLNDEQVAALQGKVEFRTKYETRTRVLDAAGNQIDVIVDEPQGVAPPHPDVEGADSQTKQKSPVEEPPKDASSSKDGEKEAEHSSPKPASEGNEATQEVNDEL